jgi:farnesyl diphosphate synthase
MRRLPARTMDPDVAFAVWSGERARRVESVLHGIFAARPGSAPELHAAMRYAVLGGGKRVRALLVYAAGELTGADPDAVDASAAAVELIHAYSLVHDDLPCMDDDVLRRGNPTCHIAFGEATALLAGDALQSLAFEVIAGTHGPAAQVALLAAAAGAAGMAGGQAIDLSSAGKRIGVAELERMHALKTGALIRAAIRLGAACGRALTQLESEALDRYASAVGLGFQVVDDVLDVEGTAQSLGKTAGKDAMQSKPTYPMVESLAAAKKRIEALHTEAREALIGFGPAARRLAEICDWTAQRTH